MPLETVQAHLEAIQAHLEVVQAPLETLQAHLDTMQAHLEAVLAPLETMQAPLEAMQAPLCGSGGYLEAVERHLPKWRRSVSRPQQNLIPCHFGKCAQICGRRVVHVCQMCVLPKWQGRLAGRTACQTVLAAFAVSEAQYVCIV